ncbi:MAG TPA: hypothetical protein VG407_00520 [Caulobacteraceae bacterium]|jgi:hypothetical protein|nr:hypothetical protein [Caulobacteraceae bacterium]
MSVNQATAGAFDIGRVIQRTFGVIGRNFVPFLLLALLFKAIPAAAVGYWTLKVQTSTLAGNNPFGMFDGPHVLVSIVSGLIGVITVFVLQAALLRGTIADLNGKRASFGDMLATGIRSFLPLLGLGIIMGLALMAGFILLIVPGIMMLVAWCAAAPSIVAEKKGVFESFTRSANLTRGHRWPIFGLFVIYMIVAWVIGAAGSALMLANRNDVQMMMAVTLGIQVVVGTLSAMIGSAGSAALYYELRTIKEGVGADTLASVFD